MANGGFKLKCNTSRIQFRIPRFGFQGSARPTRRESEPEAVATGQALNCGSSDVAKRNDWDLRLHP
jgi:hypothetical protein